VTGKIADALLTIQTKLENQSKTDVTIQLRSQIKDQMTSWLATANSIQKLNAGQSQEITQKPCVAQRMALVAGTSLSLQFREFDKHKMAEL